METVSPDAQANRRELTWEEVDARAHSIAQQLDIIAGDSGIMRLYGVPRGGIYAALAVQTAMAHLQEESGVGCVLVDSLDDADVVIDDIVDSGATLARYRALCPDIPFMALYENMKEWLVFPWEAMQSETGPQENVRRVLEYIGEDVEREGLAETPDRVVRSWDKLFGGYKEDPKKVLKVFEDDTSDEMVLLKNIEFYSTCEHHMLPFFGRCHIAYIPNGKVVGISKLARVLEVYARRMQIQERLCHQVTSLLNKELGALGAACIIEAQHFCMTSRGVEKQHSVMVTSSLTGAFRDKPEARAELLQLIK